MCSFFHNGVMSAQASGVETLCNSVFCCMEGGMGGEAVLFLTCPSLPKPCHLETYESSGNLRVGHAWRARLSPYHQHKICLNLSNLNPI